MNDHEEQFIDAFIIKERQDRYKFLLSHPKRRREATNRLDHCKDLNEKYVNWLPWNTDAFQLLKSEKISSQVYLISSSPELDGMTVSLEQAVELIQNDTSSCVISCIPGKLAYYRDEEGECIHAVLKK